MFFPRSDRWKQYQSIWMSCTRGRWRKVTRITSSQVAFMDFEEKYKYTDSKYQSFVNTPLTVVMMIIWNLQNLTHRIVSNKLLVCCQKWFNMRITGSWNSWKREEWVPDIRVETKRLFLPRPVSSLLPKYTSEFTLMLKHLISGHMKREIQMCSCQWNSQFQYENEILSLSQKSVLLWCTPHMRWRVSKFTTRNILRLLG